MAFRPTGGGSHALIRSVRFGCAPQSHTDLLSRGHGAQQILSCQLGDIGIAPASAHQLLQQRRVTINALEPDRRVRDAVEIGTQAHMIRRRQPVECVRCDRRPARAS